MSQCSGRKEVPSARAEHRRILVILTEQIGFVELIDSTLHIQRNTVILYSACLSDPILKKLAVGFLGTKLNDFCSLELDGWIVGLKCQRVQSVVQVGHRTPSGQPRSLRLQYGCCPLK